MGASSSRAEQQPSGPPPDNGVRVTANLLQSVVDRTRSRDGEQATKNGNRTDGASTSTSANESHDEQQQRQHQQQQRHQHRSPRMFGGVPGVPDLSLADFEAARLAAIDGRLAEALRKSAAVAKGQLRLEENEVAAVASAADELLRRFDGEGGGAGETRAPASPDPSAPPPSSRRSPCGAEATEVATCFLEAASKKEGGTDEEQGTPNDRKGRRRRREEEAVVAASLGCRGVVEALEACARKAAAERTESLLMARGSAAAARSQ